MTSTTGLTRIFLETLQYMFAIGMIGAAVAFVLFLIDELKTVVEDQPESNH